MRPMIVALAALLILSACVAPRRSRRRCCPREASPKTQPAPPQRETGWFQGRGRRVSEASVLEGVVGASLVVFGELHDNATGATAELKVLQAVHAANPQTALAMEFFERDVQADLDAYLAGELDQAEYLKRTKRSKTYAATHGPLIEYCKANGIPVIAANAPRRLVSGYRKFEGDYAAYRLSLSETDLSHVADETSAPDDLYRKRFYDLIGPQRAPTYFRSQSLWDDTMAESMARFRDANPEHTVMFIVGAFHVRSGLGTITKYKQRRPNDSIALIEMGMAGSKFDDDADDTYWLRVASAKQ